MKYSALTYTDITPFSSGNIGDYIQTLAALQYLPRLDILLERENLKAVPEGEEIFVIMNGWFMHRPENFPPPKNIRPFYISFCVADQKMLSPDAINHLKQHEPIGCRDAATLKALTARGVKAYFSGCLTLSLEKPVRRRKKNTYLVDIDSGVLKNIPAELKQKAYRVSHQATLFRKWKDIFYMGRVRSFKEGTVNKMFDFLYFLGRCVSSGFGRLMPTTRSANALATFLNLVRAQILLEVYAGAELVVTSRLHSALPCLAFGTPVILFSPSYKEDHDRFAAVKDYLGPFSGDEIEHINWHPQPPQVETHQKFLRLLTREAVLLGDNPLKYREIEWFYKESGWYPSAGAL